MLTKKEKQLFLDIGMEYEPVCVKYSFDKPKGLKEVDTVLSICEFAKKAQTEHVEFYVTKDTENCFGKMICGMVDKPGIAASGQAGVDFGVFKTQAANARLYHMIPNLVKGACNYISFSPLSMCRFDPDLILCVATAEQGDVIMRASSYISGDLWETKNSGVLACAWMFVEPYISGKVNITITGMEHGMNRRHVYPHGMLFIAIPFQKIPEMLQALKEMPHELIAMKTDEASKKELQDRMDNWSKKDSSMLLKH